jgi:hypothetical protein
MKENQQDQAPAIAPTADGGVESATDAAINSAAVDVGAAQRSGTASPAESAAVLQTEESHSSVSQAVDPDTQVPKAERPDSPVSQTADAAAPPASEAAEPDSSVPEVTEPDSPVPKPAEPDSSVHEVTAAEPSVPQAAEPESPVPKAAECEGFVPEAAEPDSSVPSGLTVTSGQAESVASAVNDTAAQSRSQPTAPADAGKSVATAAVEDAVPDGGESRIIVFPGRRTNSSKWTARNGQLADVFNPDAASELRRAARP